MHSHFPAPWLTLLSQPAVAIAVTILAYALAVRLQRRFPRNPLLNPTLVAILLVTSVIELAGVPYDSYRRGAGLINFMLGPAVVLLAVPLFRQTMLVRASGRLIATSLAVGLPVGIASGIGFAWLLGAHPETLLSLAPKSVTTGIAIGVSQQIGGVPALTAVFVILTGITGAICGPAMAQLGRVRDERALGLAMGVGSHGIGTARALQVSEVAGAFSSIGMSLNGVLTAAVLPIVVTLLLG